MTTRSDLGRAWLALGYSTWNDCCDAELAGARPALQTAERRQLVAEMRSDGISQRAIASGLDVGLGTVERDLAGVPIGTPAKGLDGKTYSASASVGIIWSHEETLMQKASASALALGAFGPARDA